MDYDNDGDEDILIINSMGWHSGTPNHSRESQPGLRLLANNGKAEFRDVTAGSGLVVRFQAMGVAVGDYDNDGLRDVFVTGIGATELWHNEAGGHFRDVTSASGIMSSSGRLSTSAGWVDYDNDGLLDLVVCHYGEGKGGGGVTLYRNEGAGRFSDVSRQAGLESARVLNGRCLAVAPIDLNDDGRIDLIVSNNGGPNFVFRNGGDGTFSECGSVCGLAYDNAGSEQQSRGIDTAWCRDDPCLQVAIGAHSGDALKLYSGRIPMLQFVDEAPGHGLSSATRKQSIFGVVFLDYDLDGWADLLTASGHNDAREAPQLFWNGGQYSELAFQKVSASESGPTLFKPLAGRGLACADIDGDNDPDVLITQNGGGPVLLRNDQRTGHRSLRVRLVGTRSPRDAIGARLTLHSGNHFWRAQVMPTRGYLSQSELPVTFGFGSDDTSRELEIRWPSGYVQKLRVKPTERSITVIEPHKGGLAENEPSP